MERSKIVAQIKALSDTDARALLACIVEILYGPEADHDWGADTLDAIAGALEQGKIGPID